MREYRGLESVEPEANSIVSIGTFDGVHRGHQQLIDRVKQLSAEVGGPSTLVTFEPHPQLVVSRPDRPRIRILTSLEEKRDILRAHGIDRLVVIDFTPEFASMSPQEFVERILIARIGCRVVVVGPDHGFGRSRGGTIRTLAELGQRFGFGVEVLPVLEIEEGPVNSTRIRRVLTERGDVALAERLLGRPYEVRGTVCRGSGRGRELGFPTANLTLDTPHKLLPKDGIYAGFVETAGRRYPAAINVGTRPTFNGSHRVVEAHLVGEVGDLYGTPMRIQFVERIRDEIAFPTVRDLVEQMQRDREESLRILQNYSKSLMA